MRSAQIGSTGGNITVEYLHLCERCSTYVQQFIQGDLPMAHTPCEWCDSKPGTVILEGRANEPILAGFGLPEFSTSMGLMPIYTISWDVNGYYRELGVDTDATKREIRQAYQERNGHESERLTYIVKQLLNPVVRALYDATPLGKLYIDHYVAEWIRQAQMREARDQEIGEDMWANLDVDEDDFEPVETVLDIVANARQDRQAESTFDHQFGRWGYYVWRSGPVERGHVGNWQAEITAELWQRGEVVKLAVGFLGPCMEQDWEVQRVGYRIVAFVRGWPTEGIVKAIADRVVQEHRSIQDQSRGAFQYV